uniref:ABC transporter permease n=1 Tax=candidate division WOR-3 bacterium TaxID=2052148 RepID=A0A7C3Z1X5_UNCW3
MNYKFFVSKRYVRIKKDEMFKSLITIFSIIGIGLGVGTLIVVLSVMNGMQNDLREKILGTNGHILVSKFYNEEIYDYDVIMDSLLKIQGITGATPFIYTKILIRKEENVDGIILKGIDTLTFSSVSNLNKKIILGRFELGEDGIILGNYVADGLLAHIGDTVEVALPFSELITPFGIIPRTKRFVVKGIFDAGMYDFNATLSIVSLKAAQELMGRIGVSGIELKTDNIYKVKEISKKIISRLGYPYRVSDWIDMNRNLFAALKLEKFAMFVILILIIIVASFNILSILIMTVIEKTREIGILKAIGSTSKDIMHIFILDGLIISLTGTIIGIIIGWSISWALGKYKFISLPSDVYFLDKLPVKMEITDFIIVSLSAIILSLIATLYPAIKASKMDPVEAIRNE